MSLLLGLPGDLLREVVEDWLMIIDWTKLNTAVTEHYKAPFRSVLERLSFSSKKHMQCISHGGIGMFYWLHRANIQLDFLVLSDSVLNCSCLLNMLDLIRVDTIFVENSVDETNTKIFEMINRCSLSELVIRNSVLNDWTPSRFSEGVASGLKKLSIINSLPLYGSVFCGIAAFTSLTHVDIGLDLSVTYSDYGAVALINNNPNLEQFIVRLYFQSADAMLEALCRSCPRIKQVNVYGGAFKIGNVNNLLHTHPDMEMVRVGNGRLTLLEFSQIPGYHRSLNVTRVDYSQELQEFVDLCKRDVEDVHLCVHWLNDSFLLSVTEQCLGSLRCLTLSQSADVTTSLLNFILLSTLDTLVEFRLWIHPRYTVDDIADVFRCAASLSLERLALWSSPVLDLSTVASIVQRCPRITEVDSSGCRQLSVCKLASLFPPAREMRCVCNNF